MADPDPVVNPQDVNSPYDGANDQIMFDRVDGPFATQEEIELVKRGSINEPTPLVTVNADGDPELYNPVRIEQMPRPPQPDKPPQIEPPAGEPAP